MQSTTDGTLKRRNASVQAPCLTVRDPLNMVATMLSDSASTICVHTSIQIIQQRASLTQLALSMHIAHMFSLHCCGSLVSNFHNRLRLCQIQSPAVSLHLRSFAQVRRNCALYGGPHTLENVLATWATQARQPPLLLL